MLKKCVLRSGLDACASGQESVNGCFVHDSVFSVSVKGGGFLASYASFSFSKKNPLFEVSYAIT
jgi:hypothetical protein